MKKNIFKFILLLLVIFSYSSVFADDDENSRDSVQRHIMVMESLEFKGTDMYVEGYAFISHRDNFGKKDGVGNLTNYLVAYTGDSVSLDNNGKCISTSCFSKKLAIVERDMFYGRCVASGCARHDRYEDVLKGSFDFNEGSCANDNSYCMYYNVGFNDSISLTDIVNVLGENSTFDSTNTVSGIKFKIFSIMKNNAGTYTQKSSSVGIYTSLCDVEDRDCENNKEFNLAGGLYKIKIRGVSDFVVMDADNAAGKRVNNSEIGNKEYNEKRPVFLEKVKYKVLGVSDGPLTRTVWKDNPSRTGPVSDIMYKLDSVVVNKRLFGENIDSTAISTIVPSTNNNSGISFDINARKYYDGNKCASGCNVLNSEYDDYWAFANWLKMDSSLEILTFEPNYKELSCSDIKSYKGEKKSVQTTCDDNPTANDEFYQCNRDNSVIATIYINLGKIKPTCGNFELRDLQFSSNDETIIEGKGYVLPVQVHTAVLLEQTGKFHFSNFFPEIVYAGKDFSINNNVANGISYNNTFRWLFGNVMIETNDSNYKGTPFISYIGGLPQKENGMCIEDTNFVDTALKNAFADVDGNRNKIFYEKDGKLVGAGNTLNAVVYAIDEVLKSRYDYDISKFDDVQFESCDSNSKSSTCDNKVVSGIWSESKDVNPWSFIYGDVAFNDIYAHRGFGIKRETKLEYQLPHAYVVLSDTIFNGKKYKNGDKIYSTNKLSDADIKTYNLEYVGNRYYVGFKYVYDKANEYDFPFNIVNKDVSLVDGMIWNLSGTCGVEVKNRFYKKIIPQCSKKDCGVEAKISYKFRPISLSNPFPKPQSIAINWKKWYESNPEAARIVNTKDYGVKYSIRLSKFDVDDAIKLSIINSYSLKNGSYTDLNGYHSDGSGDFINNSNDIAFSIKQGKTSYCGLGYFSSNCDQYLNSMG